jgi:hypothetical protein
MTTSRMIDLGPECIDHPTRLDLAEIEAVMLWPNSDVESDGAAATSASAYFIERHELFVDPVMSRCLAELAFRAKPLSDVQQSARPRFVDGLIAGQILYLAFERSARKSRDASMSVIYADVVAYFEPARKIKTKTIENAIWKPYRPVAHLWAAFITLHGKDKSYPFPCRAGDLPAFLGTAEAFRKWGEATKLRMSPTTVLRPGDAVTVPDNIRVPDFSLTLPAAAST